MRKTSVKPCRTLPVAAAALLLVAGACPAQAPPSVGTASVAIVDVSPAYEFVGRVEAINAVDIRTRIEGFLKGRSFEEGQTVGKDQDLFQIESASYEIALKDAQASLIGAQAALQDAERRVERNRALSRQTVSTAVLEESETAREAARAGVLSAEARVGHAELDLSYTRITAPIGGRIGKSAFAVGSLVGASSAPLARIVQVDPIRVVFSVSDRAILDLRAAAGGVLKDDLVRMFVPRLRLSNGDIYPDGGSIEFFGNEIDPQTATLSIRSVFPNPQSLLVPGQFVAVVIRQAEPKRRPVVPLGAVQQDREGRYVLLVGPDNRVTLRRIETSEQKDANLVVESGLDGGESIVVEGLQNASPGTIVEPQPVASSSGSGR